MGTKIAGFVLRARSKSASVVFYERLGLDLREHMHDGGPIHFEVGPLSDEFVVELYQGSSHFADDAMMLEVESLDSALAICAEFKLYPRDEVKDTGNMKFVYIVDLDGRMVMLIENRGELLTGVFSRVTPGRDAAIVLMDTPRDGTQHAIVNRETKGYEELIDSDQLHADVHIAWRSRSMRRVGNAFQIEELDLASVHA